MATSAVESRGDLVSAEKPDDILKKLTDPLTKQIMQLDKKIINKLGECALM
jgi:hypothetical protein